MLHSVERDKLVGTLHSCLTFALTRADGSARDFAGHDKRTVVRSDAEVMISQYLEILGSHGHAAAWYNNSNLGIISIAACLDECSTSGAIDILTAAAW